MRRIADRANHFGRHFHLARHALFLGVQNAAGNHQLDQVDLLFLCQPQVRQRLFDRVRRDRDRASHVPAGDRNALVGGKHARSDPLSCCNLIAQTGIEIPKTANRADGGHAAEQLVTRKAADHAVSQRARQCRTHDGAHQLFVVALLLLRLAVSGKVNMHVNQTRQQVFAAQVHRLVAARACRSRHDVRDGFAVHKHAEPLAGLHCFGPVQKAGTGQCVSHARRLTFCACRKRSARRRETAGNRPAR